MKKLLTTMTLVAAMTVANAPAQAESNFDFDLNTDFGSQIVFKSYIYGGRVVGIRTYLSLREYPNVNSRELMRIPNGAELSLRYTGNQDWWQVLAVTFNGQTYTNDYSSGIGWVSAKYVQTR